MTIKESCTCDVCHKDYRMDLLIETTLRLQVVKYYVQMCSVIGTCIIITSDPRICPTCIVEGIQTIKSHCAFKLTEI